MVHLRWQAGHEQQEVRDGEAEEIVVGGRVHVLAAGDDHARAHVADHAADEDDDVVDRHGDHHPQRVTLRPPRTFRALFAHHRKTGTVRVKR